MMPQNFKDAIVNNDVDSVHSLFNDDKSCLTEVFFDEEEHEDLTCLMLAVKHNAHKVLHQLLLLVAMNLDEVSRIEFINRLRPDTDVTAFQMLCNEGIWANDHSTDEELIQSVRLLYEAGADINQYAEDGNAPLYDAVWDLDFPLITWLVEHGASLDSYGDNCTLLTCPYIEQDEDEKEKIIADSIHIVRYLISKGADVDKGGVLLREAAQINSTELLDCVAYHIDVNKERYSQETKNGMLSIAVRHNATRIARDLILIGATLTDNEQVIARQNECASMLTMLLAAHQTIERINSIQRVDTNTDWFHPGLSIFNKQGSLVTYLTPRDAISWMLACKMFPIETAQEELAQDEERPRKRLRT